MEFTKIVGDSTSSYALIRPHSNLYFLYFLPFNCRSYYPHRQARPRPGKLLLNANRKSTQGYGIAVEIVVFIPGDALLFDEIDPVIPALDDVA